MEISAHAGVLPVKKPAMLLDKRRKVSQPLDADTHDTAAFGRFNCKKRVDNFVSTLVAFVK